MRHNQSLGDIRRAELCGAAASQHRANNLLKGGCHTWCKAGPGMGPMDLGYGATMKRFLSTLMGKKMMWPLLEIDLYSVYSDMIF